MVRRASPSCALDFRGRIVDEAHLSFRSRTCLHLECALRSLRLPAGYALVYVEDLPATDLRRGYGTPTILVNGRDMFGAAPSSGRLAPG